MNPEHYDLESLYDNCTDVFVVSMARQCITQLSKRRLISGDDSIELLEILSRAIDNAINANDALNHAKIFLRGDV